METPETGPLIEIAAILPATLTFLGSPKKLCVRDQFGQVRGIEGKGVEERQP
jgi:hypothetical protein